MNDRNDLLRRVAKIQPYPTNDDLPPVLLESRPPLTIRVEDAPPDTETKTGPAGTKRRRWRGPGVALGVAVSILIVGVATLVLQTTDPGEDAALIPPGAVHVTVEGLEAAEGAYLAGVLYRGEGLDYRDSHVVGGFAARVDANQVSATYLVYTPLDWGEDEGIGARGLFPYVTAEAVDVVPGIYTLMLWQAPGELGPYNRFVPADTKGLIGCQTVFEVETAGARITVAGGLASVSDGPPACIVPSQAQPLSGRVNVHTAGGQLWAWESNGDGSRVWRQVSGEWEELPTTPGLVYDLAAVAGVPWVIADGRVHYLEEDTWRAFEGVLSPWRIAADPTTGHLWFSTGQRVFRWDGQAVTDVGLVGFDPADGPALGGDVAVTSDGTAWAGGFQGYTPSWGVLAAYQESAGTWETSQPWDGKPVPASVLAPASNGGLWVVLDDWDRDDDTGRLSAEGWALGFRDGVSGLWTVFDTGLPDGYPLAIAADGDTIWLAQGPALVEEYGPMDGMYHFDGTTWTHHLRGVTVLDLAVAPGGTLWYLADQEPFILKPFEP